MQTFDLLIKPVQEAIWELEWPSFRTIQDEAIKILVSSTSDLVISAPTASGKTEAAFLPLISKYFDELRESAAILYISPLKALINDQFERVMSLCKKMDIQVTKWHGDVDYQKKQNLLKRPKGIILITPESIEALLMRKEVKARALFHALHAIVIDEVHSFIDNERGVQLYSLLNRVAYLTGNFAVRKVALSATIGDLQAVKRLLSDTPEDVQEVIAADSEKEVFGDVIVVKEDKEHSSFLPRLFELTKSGKTLVFSNGKNLLENTCDGLKKYAATKRMADIYRIHHGSLSKEIREETEKELKNARNLCVFCTSTLELGIDIGDITKVILLNPPWSVSSFIQRIGRSGRKEHEAIKFACIYKEMRDDQPKSLYERLHIPLIKSIAIIELYLEGFCEPYLFNLNEYSCMVHQLFAYLTQKGGCSAAELYEVIIKHSFKSSVNVDSFIALLEYLHGKNYIEQFDNGTIVVAEKGERITEDFHFYAVFQTADQWRVVAHGEMIGEIPFILFYKVGDQIVLGGKRWNIIAIDEAHKRLLVQQGNKKQNVLFDGDTGSVTKAIHQKMKQIFEQKMLPAYVNEEGKEVLQEVFAFYEIVMQNPYAVLLFQGSKITNTIKAILHARDYSFEDFEIGVVLNGIRKEEFLALLKTMEMSEEGSLEFVQSVSRTEKQQRKFDYLLPDELLNRMYCNDHFDYAGLEEYLKHETE